MKIVMTGSASDPLAWQDHIRNKPRREALARRIKNSQDLLKVVFVRDMWVPRSFLQPGLRLKLHPDDTYAYGANRGGIDERWFASTTEAANEGRVPDEGLSYVILGKERFTLRQAVAECGATLVGKTIWNKYKRWPVYSKFFDNRGPFHITCTRTRSRRNSSARKASLRATTSRRNTTTSETIFPTRSSVSSPALTRRRCANVSRTGTRATTASSISRRRIASKSAPAILSEPNVQLWTDVAYHTLPCENHHEMKLHQKMVEVLKAVQEIETAPTEDDAILQALAALEKLKYPHVMVSFLREIDGRRWVVGDPEYASGEKWREVAAATKRDFDNPTDMLPKVLLERKPWYIPDSRVDRSNDRELCWALGIVTQYVMPLATKSRLIGTLQVDMGALKSKPVDELRVLDALAAHLSIAIDRFRTLEEIEELNGLLLENGKLQAFDAAAGKIMHELMHSIGDYNHELNSILQRPAIRRNRDALEFLEKTKKRVDNWI
jgi:hypothetical protein